MVSMILLKKSVNLLSQPIQITQLGAIVFVVAKAKVETFKKFIIFR